MTEVSKSLKKPFPWPFWLSLFPLLILVLILWQHWKHEDFLSLIRTSWLALCSWLPGFSLMVIIGSIVQFRKRPLLSSLSFTLSVITLGTCIWTIQKITHEAPLWLGN